MKQRFHENVRHNNNLASLKLFFEFDCDTSVDGMGMTHDLWMKYEYNNDKSVRLRVRN